MPKGSPFRRLGNLEHQADAQAASFSHLPVAGGGHHDSSTGAHPVQDTFDYIWAEIQPVANASAAPVGGECSLRHEWAQQIPERGGCWNTPDYGLSGNTTMNPAFEETGSPVTNTSVIVQLRPGAAWFDNSTNTIQQEWLFRHC